MKKSILAWAAGVLGLVFINSFQGRSVDSAQPDEASLDAQTKATKGGKDQ